MLVDVRPPFRHCHLDAVLRGLHLDGLEGDIGVRLIDGLEDGLADGPRVIGQPECGGLDAMDLLEEVEAPGRAHDGGGDGVGHMAPGEDSEGLDVGPLLSMT